MLVLTETTEHQRVADLEHLNQYKDTVLASVTHDLKTPLNSMICQADMALACDDI
jgi:K+-sensing histidine kinase KdpD